MPPAAAAAPPPLPPPRTKRSFISRCLLLLLLLLLFLLLGRSARLLRDALYGIQSLVSEVHVTAFGGHTLPAAGATRALTAAQMAADWPSSSGRTAPSPPRPALLLLLPPADPIANWAYLLLIQRRRAEAALFLHTSSALADLFLHISPSTATLRLATSNAWVRFKGQPLKASEGVGRSQCVAASIFLVMASYGRTRQPAVFSV